MLTYASQGIKVENSRYILAIGLSGQLSIENHF
jgi:hypothetical protein